MIRRLVIRGFKDQDRVCDLTGLDLFTSAGENGVGKSAVLESFKLALLGEVPGRAKNVEDVLRFTSRPEMSVAVIGEAGRDSVEVERRFLRDAPPGEMRPIRIDGVDRKFEEGNTWIRDRIGAVSLSFDPHEFLNLADARKRQWIISHSPEMRSLRPGVVSAALWARILERKFSCAQVRLLMKEQGLRRWDEILELGEGGFLDRLQEKMIGWCRKQDDGFYQSLRRVLDRAFGLWSDSRSGEENLSVVLAHLKSESLRLKNAVREQVAAISCVGRSWANAKADPSAAIENLRMRVQSLLRRIENRCVRMEQGRRLAEERNRVQARIGFLRQTISGINGKQNGKRIACLRNERDEWQARLVDVEDMEKDLKRIELESTERSRVCVERQTRLQIVASELKTKREQYQGLGSGKFQCPVALGIRCETDMDPYRESLRMEIGTLSENEKQARGEFAEALDAVERARERLDRTRSQLERHEHRNREAEKQIARIGNEIASVEKESAQTTGTLKACREELASLESVAFGEATDVAALQQEKEALQREKEIAENELSDFLRVQGKADAVRHLVRKKEKLEGELEAVRLVCELLGPDGIQGRIAARVASALEREVNDMLRLIDPEYEFVIDLSGPSFEMGWNRDGRIVPFNTINSAHFILFIVPLLMALVRRLARCRERIGLPTLKALCIEAESLTPANLSVLLRGLSLLKQRGFLDHALVAHYHSVRDPDKLYGFSEHVLRPASCRQEQELDLAAVGCES